MANAHLTFAHNTPETKEAYYIRQLFTKHYPGNEAARTVLKWTPKWQLNTDPSGRASAVHVQSVELEKKENAFGETDKKVDGKNSVIISGEQVGPNVAKDAVVFG